MSKKSKPLNFEDNFDDTILDEMVDEEDSDYYYGELGSVVGRGVKSQVIEDEEDIDSLLEELDKY